VYQSERAGHHHRPSVVAAVVARGAGAPRARGRARRAVSIDRADVRGNPLFNLQKNSVMVQYDYWSVCQHP
jgi:hypothetical protein